jgi:pimeloyl-ACP methyl ester carboxylesterase
MSSSAAAVAIDSTIGRSFPWPVRLAGLGLRSIARLSPAAAARGAERLFLTPRRSKMPEREATWLAEARRETVEAGGRSIATWVWEGASYRPPTVLLVHGWGGRGSQLGAFVAPLRAQGARVVAFDAPAHGRSAGRQTNLIQFADTVAALLGRYSEWAPVRGIVGHSFGAAAATIALARGARAERVVLLAPAEDYSHFTGRFRRALGLDAPIIERMQRGIEQRIGVDWSDVRGGALAARLSQPALVIHDDQDREVPLAHGETIVKSWPGARLVRTSGLGHQRLLRDADVIDAAVGHLLTDAPAAFHPSE